MGSSHSAVGGKKMETALRAACSRSVCYCVVNISLCTVLYWVVQPQKNKLQSREVYTQKSKAPFLLKKKKHVLAWGNVYTCKNKPRNPWIICRKSRGYLFGERRGELGRWKIGVGRKHFIVYNFILIFECTTFSEK